jgi:hypothetical protein
MPHQQMLYIERPILVPLVHVCLQRPQAPASGKAVRLCGTGERVGGHDHSFAGGVEHVFTWLPYRQGIPAEG